MSDFTCPICGGASANVLESQSDWLVRAKQATDERRLIGEIVASDETLSFDAIVRCASCGFATVMTPPTPSIPRHREAVIRNRVSTARPATARE